MPDSTRDEIMILVVDDDQSIRELFAELLKSQGYRIVAAESAAQALDILAALPICLIISDHSMPDKTGGRLIQEVRTLYNGTRTILASANPHLPHLAQLAGADRYFLKGEPLTNLLTIIDELIGDGRRMAS